jgi:hypothetical protein
MCVFIFKSVGIPVELQGLEFQGCCLQDEHVISSYNLAKDSVVDLVEGAPQLQLSFQDRESVK